MGKPNADRERRTVRAWIHGDIFQISLIHKIFDRRTNIRSGRTYVRSEFSKACITNVYKGAWKGAGIVLSKLFIPLLQFINNFFTKLIQKQSHPFPIIVARWGEEKQESPHKVGGKEQV